jgi:ATP-dependent DNA helicase RecG
MNWSEKEEQMLLFHSKKDDVLISTTVIEVGIDIPDANIILINDAHRFGLSQLHQLRGRVGRSSTDAYCILVTRDEFISTGKQQKDIEYLSASQIDKLKTSIRLNTMIKYNDGFKIAEVDMKLRGPGDIFGKKQTGFPELKHAILPDDIEILIDAKQSAFNIIEADPRLDKEENKILRETLTHHHKENLKYARIA